MAASMALTARTRVALRERRDLILAAHEHQSIPADFEQVCEALRPLRDRASTFLEWGSGTGVIATAAALLGFESYGIELDAGLVELSRGVARDFGADVTFAAGSFVPETYEWDPRIGDEDMRTDLDGPAAYETLEMRPRDFDLVYAYPWHEEIGFYRDLARHCGVMLLLHQGDEGMALFEA